MNLPKVLSLKVYNMLNSDKFLKEMSRPRKIDRTYDIPYVAGYSKDANTIFVDVHYKKMLGSFNTEPYIILHEKTEKALLDIFRMDYQQAHHVATHVERDAIRNLSINWEKYEKFVLNQYHTIDKEKLLRVPANLDIEPYKDEKDLKLLKNMMHHEH